MPRYKADVMEGQPHINIVLADGSMMTIEGASISMIDTIEGRFQITGKAKRIYIEDDLGRRKDI